MKTRTRASIAIAIGAAAITTAQASALPAFTTTAKTGPAVGTTSKLVKVTVGHHAAFDRVVFRFTGGRPGWNTHSSHVPPKTAPERRSACSDRVTCR